MRLLVVTHYFDDHRGGVEIVAGELARRFVALGHEVSWAASGPEPETPEEGLVRLPMAASNLSERLLGLPYPLWGPRSLLRLAREIRRSDLVQVHDSLYMGNVFAAIVARLARKPLVVTQHIGLVQYSTPGLQTILALANRTISRWVLQSAEQSVFISEKVQAYFEDFVRFRRPPLFVPNGVSECFLPLADAERAALRTARGYQVGRPLILFVGRFVEKKGLRFVRHLAASEPGCRFLLVGWGVEDPREWNLPNVEVVGSLAREEIVPYYQMADLLVLPSVGEGFPLVVQEAMACGTPVLISDDTARGMEAVRSVAFVAERDRGALLDLFRRLVASPGMLEERRVAAADFARRHWSWERAASRYQELFVDLTGTEASATEPSDGIGETSDVPPGA